MTGWLSCATVNHGIHEKYSARSRISFKSSARSQKSVLHAGYQITVFVKSIGRGDRLRSIVGRGDQILTFIATSESEILLDVSGTEPDFAQEFGPGPHFKAERRASLCVLQARKARLAADDSAFHSILAEQCSALRAYISVMAGSES